MTRTAHIQINPSLNLSSRRCGTGSERGETFKTYEGERFLVGIMSEEQGVFSICIDENQT